MNPLNRVFLILGVLTVGSLIWYLTSTHHSSDLELIGTVDANEVLVSSKIPGRIQALNVDEGDTVQAGQPIAVIESEDLQAARAAAEATAAGQKFKLGETVETERQTRGETGSATVNAEALGLVGVVDHTAMGANRTIRPQNAFQHRSGCFVVLEVRFGEKTGFGHLHRPFMNEY